MRSPHLVVNADSGDETSRQEYSVLEPRSETSLACPRVPDHHNLRQEKGFIGASVQRLPGSSNL